MNKRCPICREAFEKFQVLYFDQNNVFYHISCFEENRAYLPNLKGMCWLTDVPDIHLFSYPLE